MVYNGVPGLQLHETRHVGLMNAQWPYLDAYSAAALNRIAGRRATAGNYVQPTFNQEYWRGRTELGQYELTIGFP